MTEDELLKELGDLARREQEAEVAFLDERWDRLAAGTLSAEEDAELRALAASSPEIGEVYEAFRPLGADFQARVAAAATAELARGPAPQPVEDAPQPEQKSGARVLLFPGVFRPLAWLGSVAAAAAVLFLFIHKPPMPLPVYEARLEGGAQAMRGGEPGPAKGLPVFVPGSLLTLNVRPRQAVEGPASSVEARGFLGPLSGSGEILPWKPEPPFEIKGAFVHLRGTLGQEIQIPPGMWRIWIVVGRPGKLPSADELAAALSTRQTRRDGWQALSADLRVDDRAPP